VRRRSSHPSIASCRSRTCTRTPSRDGLWITRASWRVIEHRERDDASLVSRRLSDASVGFEVTFAWTMGREPELHHEHVDEPERGRPLDEKVARIDFVRVVLQKRAPCLTALPLLDRPAFLGPKHVLPDRARRVLELMPRDRGASASERRLGAPSRPARILPRSLFQIRSSIAVWRLRCYRWSRWTRHDSWSIRATRARLPRSCGIG
jgi:hypothetical protein